MSKTKEYLVTRKKEIEIQLKQFDSLTTELNEIKKALAALEPPRCESRCTGCAICRNGPDYR